MSTAKWQNIAGSKKFFRGKFVFFEEGFGTDTSDSHLGLNRRFPYQIPLQRTNPFPPFGIPNFLIVRASTDFKRGQNFQLEPG
jgi:hypothetical protein